MKLTIRTAAFSALIALGVAGAAQAQAPAPTNQDGQRGPPMAGQIQAQMRAIRDAHERQRAQDLRTVLRLRPDQEPALTAFLQSRKPPAPPAERRGPPSDAMTTPQRLDEMSRRESEQAARLQRHAEALRVFYTALNTEQRQVFDALARMQGGGRERGGGGRGGWGRHGFGGPRGPMGGRMGGPPTLQ